MSARFTTLFIILTLHNSDNSLLSRFRNPTEFVAPEDSPDINEMDQDLYEELLEEIPELRQATKGNLSLPYLKRNFEQTDEYDFMINSADYDYNSNSTFESTENINASSINLPSNNSSNSSEARRYYDYNYWRYWKGPRVATCYVCNVSNRRGIPTSPLCHDAFNSQDGRATTVARYFRAHCYQNSWHWGVKIETKWKNSRFHEWDQGLFRGYYGAYIGGCYKRFLDVGAVYTARGCRSMMPKVGGGYADHRYRKLEVLLKGQKNVCVMSPHASLTPFSRAISLYVRYHVCVCEGKYCNRASFRHSTIALFLLLLLQFVL